MAENIMAATLTVLTVKNATSDRRLALDLRVGSVRLNFTIREYGVQRGGACGPVQGPGRRGHQLKSYATFQRIGSNQRGCLRLVLTVAVTTIVSVTSYRLCDHFKETQVR
ncbi:hypothetical protein J6590_010977 [Homalodisca vitripennis]|nr:hypothetical protein J6590_010977 [Homalodisca vitripennis]